MAPLIEFRDVSKTFTSRAGTVSALASIDLEIEAGEIFAIIGHSGAGKSTLVRLINALEGVTSGTVTVDGVVISEQSEREARRIRSRIGMIFQQFNLFRSRTVFGNVAYPLKLAGWSKERQRARVAELLAFVGLTDKAWAYPDQLSGGQKQRVGIARALANNPTILLADESTSALDPETTQDVLRLLRRVNSELGLTVVVVTHEMDVVRSIADRVAVMEAGKVIEVGTVFDVFSAPRTDTTRRFVNTILRNRPDAEDVARLRKQYEGSLVSVTVDGDTAIGEVLADAVRRHDLRFEIVHGGIDTLQGRSFGSVTLALSGTAEDIEKAVARLGAVAKVEVLA
ncbi:methionine import ATP-binding protein MetN [Streptomyces viridiviolaceus]|uniref:Methionine ABC transporter ATP-binding protein n=1 Tax=Streptomyces viridiviolaceus TaxID=68282 RepID=A0ABW2E012_9ACTN|nr:methionine ABC transporter ATP-binding protein [Streptomyces viridiviolaceus]GHB72117.1 methionine import ATP-binding protein MetN [Streptomyces viridiviolaceus]